MKYLIIILVLNAFKIPVVAQGKFDNYFLSGYYRSTDTINVPQQGGLTVDFSSYTPIAYRKDRYMSFFNEISLICNDTGKLLFYTNGIYINDARDSIMQNGDTLNVNNKQFLNYTSRLTGGWLDDASIILPMPDQKYYLFHTDYKDIKPNAFDFKPAQIKVSTIDLKLNKGYGAVTQKGKLVWDAEPWGVQGLISATRHANGRDWWVTTNTDPYNKYLTFLATPDSVYGPFIQEFGTFNNTNGTGNGNLVFSPDGTKLAYSNIVDGIVFFDFDRCTGKLSNYRKIPLVNVLINFGSICFSPNSRYLYLTNLYNLYQYDTDASDITNSKIHIDTFDGYRDPFYNSLFQMKLGPDGKIYMSSYNGVYSLHVINNPNKLGKACNFKQHSFKTAGIAWGAGLPNFPNYRLGPLKGSGCDTLGIHIQEKRFDEPNMSIYPNPASDLLKVEVTFPSYDTENFTELVVYDVAGRLLHRQEIPFFAYMADIDLAPFPSGVYILQLLQNNKVIKTSKFVVVR